MIRHLPGRIHKQLKTAEQDRLPIAGSAPDVIADFWCLPTDFPEMTSCFEQKGTGKLHGDFPGRRRPVDFVNLIFSGDCLFAATLQAR
jgi:hypothetical protein